MIEPIDAPSRQSPATLWAPILEGNLRAIAHDALFDIAEALPPPGSPTSDSSLATGEAGLAIFHAYFAASGLLPPQHIERHRDLASAHLQSAVDKLPAPATGMELYSSFVGVAWATNHVQTMGVLPATDDLCAATDEAVLDGLRDHASSMLCELVTGLSGIGVYGLSRWHRPAGRKIVERVVRALEESAVRHWGLRTWFHSPQKMSCYGLRKTPEGCFNLGLSHGVPGALVFLARAAAYGVQGAQKLLAEATHWLLLQQRNFANGSRFWCSAIEGPGHEIEGSGVAWCFGDLGLSAALLLVARCARRAKWEATALDLARNVACRAGQGDDVMDAALCHGAFGNAHLFSRLHAASGEPSLREAALRWVRKGLALRNEGRGPAGFSAWLPAEPDEPARDPWLPRFGLLEGIAGIGVAMLGLLAPVEPAWDEVLMVNIPAPPQRREHLASAPGLPF